MQRRFWFLLVWLVVAGCAASEIGEKATAVPPTATLQLAPATSTATAVLPAYPAPASAYPFPATAIPDLPYLPPATITPLPTLPPSPTPIPSLTPIWGDARPQAPPAGLVYVDPEGLWQITAGGQKRQLWTRSPVTLSPDGQRAMYQEGETLIIADLTTGTESTLDLSGYGEWCCAVWGGNEMILLGTLPEGELQEQTFGYLTAVSLDGSWQKVLDPEEKFGTYPALSPDGRTVAYGMARLVQLDGRVEDFDPAEFADFPSTKQVGIGSPAWSPDGTKLAWYIAGNIGGNGDWAAAVAVFDLEEKTAVILHPYRNLGRDGWFAAPVWSPDGRWLAFNAEAEDFSQNGVWVAAADGTEEHFLGGMGGSDLVWRPDGRFLTYTVWNMAEQENMILMADTETWTAVPLDLPPEARIVFWSEAQDISANGQWRVITHVSDPVPPEDDEAGQFPNGKYNVEMVVERADGSQSWTAVDEWRPWGLGYTIPQPVRWSGDGRYFYFANVPVPDGCVGLVNGGDLWRLDLTSGEVIEVAPYIGLTMALSPDETKLAVNASYGRGFLIRNLATGEEQPIPLPQLDDGGQISGLAWSPDGRHLLLLQAIKPCSPETETAVILIDVDTLTATLGLEPDGQFTLLDWTQGDEARLQDSNGRIWHLNPFTGEITAGD